MEKELSPATKEEFLSACNCLLSLLSAEEEELGLKKARLTDMMAKVLNERFWSTKHYSTFINEDGDPVLE